MFQYEFEKRPPSAASCSSQATVTTDWSRVYPSAREHAGASANARSVSASVDRARRPLPPRPIVCDALPAKTSVPLKVWIIASASCFAVCAALVLATVVITKWGTDSYTTRELYSEAAEPIYSNPHPRPKAAKAPTTTGEPDVTTNSDEIDEELQMKISIFKNIVANREKIKRVDNKKPDLSLVSKPQIHPIHDTSLHHEIRRIEKKDQAKYPLTLDITRQDKELLTSDTNEISKSEIMKQIIASNDLKAQLSLNNEKRKHDNVPEFRPTLPDVMKMVDGYVTGLRKHEIDYEEYYNDENLYDDYMQSNTMTSYLIEKVQELHEWINTDPDFKAANITRAQKNDNDFTQLLKALNDSLVEGNVTIIMSKLKDIYFGDNYTMANHSRKLILSNSTDLLSFGILTLDIMLLHNIQLMAWENQEPARNKMLKDPDVFAFNALFLEPGKVEAKHTEVFNQESAAVTSKRQNSRHGFDDYYEFGKNLLENVLEIGMSTARAAIHLGRAYKNTKIILTQLSNRESLSANIQEQISRHSDANTHALHHLQSSFNGSVANVTEYTELDCVWLLYCRNLMATAKLNAPYGPMARINGMALRMLTGELSADKALDTMLYEVLTGWTELRCNDMFPRCSKVDAASVVMDSILQPLRKTQSNNNRSR